MSLGAFRRFDKENGKVFSVFKPGEDEVNEECVCKIMIMCRVKWCANTLKNWLNVVSLVRWGGSFKLVGKF